VAHILRESLPNIWHALVPLSAELLVAACIAQMLATALHEERWEEDQTGLEWAVATGDDFGTLLQGSDRAFGSAICSALKSMRCGFCITVLTSNPKLVDPKM
jgi:hypothetical protein